MKNFTIISLLIAFTAILPQGFAFNNDTTNNNNLTVFERDVIVDLSAKVFENKIYFNLSMLNESKDGVYSLVKTYKDGTFESVGIKDIAVNEINQPILYSFVEENKPTEIVIYELIRISLNVEIVETWQYLPIEDRISGHDLSSLIE